MKSPQKSARERILETADDLFYREGIHAVGIDTIIEKSGVAKMSLYRNFASKDDLVAAYLEARGQRYWQWWDGVMALNPSQPRRQLRNLFEAIAVRTRQPQFRGLF
jgi:AcrR family transcriptional regulator